MTETVAILGPGAVGGALAVHLSSAGVRIVCVARPERAGRWRTPGSRSRSKGGEHWSRRPEVRGSSPSPSALLVVAVKAHQLEEALEHIDTGAVENALVFRC